MNETEEDLDSDDIFFRIASAARAWSQWTVLYTNEKLLARCEIRCDVQVIAASLAGRSIAAVHYSTSSIRPNEGCMTCVLLHEISGRALNHAFRNHTFRNPSYGDIWKLKLVKYKRAGLRVT